MAEKVPRLIAGVDVRRFKLDPMDGFLMTRIDGKLGLKDLARETGLPDFSVARALEKLEKLGVVEIVEPGSPEATPTPEAPVQPVRKSTIAQFDDGLLAPKYDVAELEEVADLTPEQKKRILDFFYRLDDLDHYTLLGVQSDADKKGIKRAYFELAAAFHPDRYFNKKLGSFKAKMEALFTRATEAHDTLVNVEQRVEYDAYLAEVATTRGMEAMLERAMAESAQVVPPAAVSLPPARAPTPLTPPPSGPTADDIRARREALARRLTGGAGRAARPPSERPSPLRYSNPQDAMNALKRRYEDRVESATQAHAQRYIETAEDALAKNDLVAASTAFNVATKFAPDDGALAMRAHEVKTLADKTLSESYHKQALYEERQGHWLEAGRSWLKLAKLRNDPVSHERAANALLHSPDGDLHDAAEHAKQAIMLAPEVVENHVTLVEIYVKAGLTASAKRAAEAASSLDPKHTALQAVMKRIQKG